MFWECTHVFLFKIMKRLIFKNQNNLNQAYLKKKRERQFSISSGDREEGGYLTIYTAPERSGAIKGPLKDLVDAGNPEQ